jgi:hypothetical protein
MLIRAQISGLHSSFLMRSRWDRESGLVLLDTSIPNP